MDNIDKELRKAIQDHCGPILLGYAETMAKEEIPVEQEEKEEFIYNLMSSTVACLLGADLIILKKRNK